MSSFRAFLAQDCPERVYEYTPDSSTAWVQGDLVYYDTTANTVKLCGADPALIAAVAVNPAAYTSIVNNGKVPLQLLRATDVIVMASDTDFADTMIMDEVDISNAGSGVWKVLPGSTSNPRVKIVGGIPASTATPDGTQYFVQVLAANVQADAIAS